MIRLAWRQARTPAISTAALLAALVVLLVVSEHSMTSFMHTSGLSACVTTDKDCTFEVGAFKDRYGGLAGFVSALTFIPVLVGLFWGAPLVAREVENGTHRLVWSQSISRGSWLTVKLGMFLMAAAAVGVGLTVLFTWWFGPFTHLGSVASDNYSRIQTGMFDSHGIVLTVSMIYAFALGTAAGAVIRRTVPAMAVALAGYFSARLGLQLIRGHFLAARTIIYPLGAPNPRTGLGDWILDQHPIDRAGNAMSYETVFAACPKDLGRTQAGVCAAAHGFQTTVIYQPLNRFWPFQEIESGILVGLTVLLLAITVTWTLRRIS